MVNEVSGELRPPKRQGLARWRVLDWAGLAAALEVVASGRCQVSDAGSYGSYGWRRHLLDLSPTGLRVFHAVSGGY